MAISRYERGRTITGTYWIDEAARDLIVQLRKQNHSVYEISELLRERADWLRYLDLTVGYRKRRGCQHATLRIERPGALNRILEVVPAVAIPSEPVPLDGARGRLAVGDARGVWLREPDGRQSLDDNPHRPIGRPHTLVGGLYERRFGRVEVACRVVQAQALGRVFLDEQEAAAVLDDRGERPARCHQPRYAGRASSAAGRSRLPAALCVCCCSRSCRRSRGSTRSVPGW